MTGLLNIQKSSGIEVLRYTVFWLKWFLNDGAPQYPEIVGNRGVKVYRFLAEMVSE